MPLCNVLQSLFPSSNDPHSFPVILDRKGGGSAGLLTYHRGDSFNPFYITILVSYIASVAFIFTQKTKNCAWQDTVKVRCTLDKHRSLAGVYPEQIV